MTKELEAALKVIQAELGVTLRVRPLTDYKPDPRNMRKHGDRNKGLIRESISEVGAGRSLVADPTDTIRAGNATIGEAPGAGIEEAIEIVSTGKRMVVHKRSDLTERQAIRLGLADNAATDASGWDTETILFEMKRDPEIIAGIFDESDDILVRLRGMMTADGETGQQAAAKKLLADRFRVPPFSVLDARQGYWQDRKRAWLALGIESEIGRGGAGVLQTSETIWRLKPGAEGKRANPRKKEGASPGGSPRPAMRQRGGKTTRGDGHGRTLKN